MNKGYTDLEWNLLESVLEYRQQRDELLKKLEDTVKELERIVSKASWTATSVKESKIYKKNIEELIEGLKKELD